MTDTEWLLLMQQSPGEGCRALIDQYGNLVYAIVLNKLKHTGTREDIEDCVSDVFVELFRSVDSYTAEGGSLKGYISTIAKRTAVDAWRRLSYRQRHTSYIEEDVSPLPAADDPEEEVSRKLLGERLWHIVRALGEPDTSIIIRQYFYEQTAKEIAKALSMSAAAVQKRSVRARKRIREMLENETGSSRKEDGRE